MRQFNDTFKHKGLRIRLVETIKDKGITDLNVLKAIDKIPRHFFMENYLDARAYEDRAQPISAGQTISQPYTVAYQTELLEVKPGDKVLEIGTGSGYQAAVLMEMGAKLFTIERHRSLYIQTHNLLTELGYNPHCFFGDGYEGKPTYGPYDKILITAAAPFIPKELIEQLKIGGMLVAPVGDAGTQIMTRIIKTSDTEYEKQEFGYFVFVPMLKGVIT